MSDVNKCNGEKQRKGEEKPGWKWAAVSCRARGQERPTEKGTDEQGLSGDEGGRLCVLSERVMQEEEPASAKALGWEHG